MEETAKLRKQLARTRVAMFVLVIFCVLFFIYGYVQKLVADRYLTELMRTEMVIKQSREEAERQREIAEQKYQEAQNQHSGQVQQQPTIDKLKAELENQRKLAEENQRIAAENEQRARQMESLAKLNEIAAKRALEECEKRKSSN